MNLYQTISRRISAITNLFLLTLVLTVTMQAQTSSVDLSFNATPSRESGYVGNFVFQPDGKILVLNGIFIVNGVAKNQIARLNSDGSSDSSFDCAACGDFNIGTAVVQPDGKIIVAGSSVSPVSGSYPAIVKRLNSDGSLDNSFVLSFDAQAVSSFSVWAIQPDGKFIVSTSTYTEIYASYPFNRITSYAVYRINTNGSLDNTFRTITSRSENTISSYITKIALQADEKILVSSNSSSATSQSVGRIQRYNSDGTTDPTFEAPTLTNSSSSGNAAYVSDFDIHPDGKIVCVGQFTRVTAIERVKIVRLLPNGNVDLSFVPAYNFLPNDWVNQVRVLSNGQVLTGGRRLLRFNSDGSLDNRFNTPADLFSFGKWDVDVTGRILLSGGFPTNSIYSRFVRLNPDGSLDNSFNTDFEAPGTIYASAIQTDGKIIVSGIFTRINGVPQKSFARLNPDGSIDSTFDARTRFSAAVGFASKILIQPDGKILVIGGFIANDRITRTQVARLNSDGSPDTSFNTIVYSENRSVSAIALQADGKILIGGNFTKVNGTDFTGLARLNTDGTVDSSFYPLFSGGISSLAVQTDGKIMVGGLFSVVNGFSRKNLVRLKADGTLDSSFNASNIDSVYQIEIQADGKYVLMINGYRIVRLNNNGTTDIGFQSVYLSTNSDYLVTTNTFLIQPDGSIIVVGNFRTVNGIPRSNIARLKPNGNVDTTFFPNGADGDIRTINRQADGKIVIGGSFTRVAGVTRIGIARLTVVPYRTVASFDFDGDGKSDISVFRPETGVWYLLNSTSGFTGAQFGLSTDKLAPADFDGDGKTDFAVYRNGIWYIQRSKDGFTGIAFGEANDIPVPADYDSDGKADVAVFRPSNGVWYILRSKDGFTSRQFGQNGDLPTIGDFDGDGKSDIAVFRPSTGYWYRINSSFNQWSSIAFGEATDKPVPADYDGDGKTDIAVYRPSNGTWYLQRSRLGFTAMQFGISTDKLVPADYDGDGKADIAVFRNGTWYLQRSMDGFSGVLFGASTDIPIPGSFAP